MNLGKKITIFSFCLFLVIGLAAQAFAADGAMKIATISIQKIIDSSKSGQEARKVLEAKQNELKPQFEAEQMELQEQAKEIEKKSSAWSDDVRLEKERDYQKRMREYQLKVEDAQFELKQLEKKVLNPIFKELQAVIEEVGKKSGYSLVLEKSQSSGLLYADESLDITDAVTKELDARMAK